MGDFRQGGSKSFGGGREGGGFGGRDRGPATMHQATCAQCGGSCEVPFRPVDGRPVYCNTCFQDIRERDMRKTGNFRSPDRFPQKDFSHKPRPDFGGSGGGNNNELKKQLEMLNAKMDRLIRAAEIMANIKPAVAEVKAEAKKEVSAKTEAVVKDKKNSKKAAKKKKK